jgi:anti-sigma regulatory factor (Ser/Thr protein kinase)
LTRLVELLPRSADLFLQIAGVPAGPAPIGIVSRGGPKEDPMSADGERGPVQLGAAAIPTGPEAASIARALVSEWLDGRGTARIRDDARLLVSELVTNSVLHAGQLPGVPVRIRAGTVDAVVRVEVHDHGRGWVRRRTADGRAGGLGLRLVEQLAARWGVHHDDGTCVWFELAPRGSGT